MLVVQARSTISECASGRDLAVPEHAKVQAHAYVPAPLHVQASRKNEDSYYCCHLAGKIKNVQMFLELPGRTSGKLSMTSSLTKLLGNDTAVIELLSSDDDSPPNTVQKDLSGKVNFYDLSHYLFLFCPH